VRGPTKGMVREAKAVGAATAAKAVCAAMAASAAVVTDVGVLRSRGGAHRSCRRRRTPRRGSLPRIARDRGQSLPGARTQAKPHVASAQHNCAAQLRNTISAFQQPTPKAALFGVQAYRGIRSRLTLGRRALRVRSFSGSQASRRNSNATVRRVCRMCAGRGMSQIGGQGATWVQCGVSHPPDRRSDLFPSL
jgi:hypothetical protein